MAVMLRRLVRGEPDVSEELNRLYLLGRRVSEAESPKRRTVSELQCTQLVPTAWPPDGLSANIAHSHVTPDVWAPPLGGRGHHFRYRSVAAAMGYDTAYVGISISRDILPPFSVYECTLVCSLVYSYRSFGGIYSLHLQGRSIISCFMKRCNLVGGYQNSEVTHCLLVQGRTLLL
jgi:hypothetical protein